ncbi:hypothetical protein [Lentilitoribacter sp. Alg239-R112]|uniref:hypothetical protein n=1 Tax=Lentilitoribacter sp. Alg239-R112 TaxID=2305987 RepID=UPI0013A6E1C6|nr:hypothetical protein [Lentilitoribacter sp. Alg239-R112]
MTVASLAGLADLFIEWHAWFEVGVMVHWRDLKIWIIENLLGWWPWTFPWWGFEYFVIGIAFARATVLNLFHQWREETEVFRVFNTQGEFIKGSLLLVVANLFFWPIYAVFSLFKPEYFEDDETLRELVTHLGQVRTILIISLIYFLPILFFCSKLLEKFGLII